MISRKTAEQVLKILCKYTDSQEAAVDMVRELAQVEGNKSFRDSVQMLLAIVENRG